jgi:TldD protein
MTDGSYDWDQELDELPALLAEKAKAPGVSPGSYDVIIDPSNLWLTIHESIGHATELDRILGYETNYAGTTFVNLDDLGTLRYGSPLLNVTGDRCTPYGLSTIGYDDEGIAAMTFPLITEGVLTGVQSDRSSAVAAGLPASTGCAYAEGADSVPLQRMPNISMQPAAGGPDLDALIGSVEDGLYIKGDDSWSIDMQRRNFQFTGQQFWRIRNGRLAGQVSDAAYQSTTPEFWNSLSAVGDQSTYELNGALICGKGQPGQGAPVSHGAPAARFDQVNIINTAKEKR